VSRDAWLLFATRFVRLFAYGLVSVVLVLYLGAVGLNASRIGALLTLTLVGDVGVSLWLATAADRLGRRRVLLGGALLMAAAGLVFATSSEFWFLLLAATIGVISPNGNEVGPFLPVEQAALAQLVPAHRRTGLLAWYNLTGSFATAVGALAGGAVAQFLHGLGWTDVATYRPLMIAYALIGLLLALIFASLSPTVEVSVKRHEDVPKLWWGLHRSRQTVVRLAVLFSLDAFGGGFVVQSAVAWWFHTRFGTSLATLGTLFFAANILAGLSAFAATALARRIGLVRTMVYTHIPSNVLLILVPLMPNQELAIVVFLLRYSISQMDVPTRQSYTLAVVAPEERSAAAGVTGVARSVGAALSPFLAAVMFGSVAWASAPFFFAGGIKIVYDLLLYRRFVAIRPPEESSPS